MVITYGFKAGWFQNKILVEIIDSSNAACIQKAHFFSLGQGWGKNYGDLGFFWWRGILEALFFSFSKAVCFFIKNICIEILGKFNRKRGKKKSWLYTRKTKKFQFCLNFFVKKCRNFASKKTIAKRQGKNTLCGDMVQSLFFFGAKCKELRGYGTISFFLVFRGRNFEILEYKGSFNTCQ